MDTGLKLSILIITNDNIGTGTLSRRTKLLNKSFTGV